jgi:ABC-type multidrug transport system permease subunit
MTATNSPCRLWWQTEIVTQRMNVALYRNVKYTNNNLSLHVVSALFNGFTFWSIGDHVSDLHLVLFTIFNLIFVAPGVIAQLQPLFIPRLDSYNARAKKSKIYSWVAFCTGLIVSEIPYLVVCAVLYFVCWNYTAVLPTSRTKTGGIFFVMLFYEFVYTTSIGQSIAAYAPNAVFASLVNPLVIGVLVSFCGVLMPYAQITAFWRYSMYYLNPFTYLMRSLLTFSLWDKEVRCV